jgi:hypothetical protein
MDLVSEPTEITTEALDPKDFEVAFSLASAALENKLPPGLVESSVGRRAILKENGRVFALALPNTPEVRVFDAMRHHYQGQPKYVSASLRVLALMRLVESGQLARWIVPSPEGPMAHKAIVRAAATSPLRLNPASKDFQLQSGFDATAFDQLVAELAPAVDAEDLPPPPVKEEKKPKRKATKRKPPAKRRAKKTP